MLCGCGLLVDDLGWEGEAKSGLVVLIADLVLDHHAQQRVGLQDWHRVVVDVVLSLVERAFRVDGALAMVDVVAWERDVTAANGAVDLQMELGYLVRAVQLEADRSI